MEQIPFINLEYIFYQIYRFLTTGGPTGLLSRIEELLLMIRPYSVIISLLLVTGIVYCVIRIHQIRTEENQAYYHHGDIPSTAQQKPEHQRNERWENVKELLESDNANDWRQAILEADIMLHEMLERMGYEGEGVGERLKQIDRSDFQTLDKAWEAHKARNAVAHEGAGYSLTRRQARKIIDQFREVFEEFYYI